MSVFEYILIEVEEYMILYIYDLGYRDDLGVI